MQDVIGERKRRNKAQRKLQNKNWNVFSTRHANIGAINIFIHPNKKNDWVPIPLEVYQWTKQNYCSLDVYILDDNKEILNEWDR